MKKNFKTYGTLIVLVVVVFSLFAITRGQKTDNTKSGTTASKVYTIEKVSAPTKDKAVDFTYNDGGKTKSFAELTKGKVVFLNFWGTWCPPCRREIPDIVQLHKELKGKDFIIIGMATERDKDNAVTNVSNFAANNDISYINFIANADIQKAYGGINAVPTTFIIDKKGNITETLVGMRDKATFLASVNRVLK